MNEQLPPLQTEEQVMPLRVFAGQHPQLQEWSAPTHYAAIEKTTLQVPEHTSSVPIGEVSGKPPEGTIRPIQIPNKAGTLETWFNEGVGTDAHGEERISLSNPESGQRATMPSVEYARVREASVIRKNLGSAAIGTAKPRPSVEKVHEPFIATENEKAGPRSEKIPAANNIAQPAKTAEAHQAEQRQAELDMLSAELKKLEAKHTDQDKTNLFFYATNQTEAYTVKDDKIAQARWGQAASYKQKLSPEAQKDAQAFLDIWIKFTTLRDQK